MLCRVCREDLPQMSFLEAEYNQARVSASCPLCLDCKLIPKVERPMHESRAVADLRVTLHIAMRPSKAERRAARLERKNRAKGKTENKPKKTKQFPKDTPEEEARWRSLSLDEKRAELIQRQTPSELALAAELTSQGIQFEPQVRIARYYIDFHIFPDNLAVEVDGEYHFTPEQKELDRARDKTIKKAGWAILRFTNEQVRKDLGAVIAEIRKPAKFPIPKAATQIVKAKWPKLPKVGAIAKSSFPQGVVVVKPNEFPYGANV